MGTSLQPEFKQDGTNIKGVLVLTNLCVNALILKPDLQDWLKIKLKAVKWEDTEKKKNLRKLYIFNFS